MADVLVKLLLLISVPTYFLFCMQLLLLCPVIVKLNCRMQHDLSASVLDGCETFCPAVRDVFFCTSSWKKTSDRKTVENNFLVSPFRGIHFEISSQYKTLPGSYASNISQNLRSSVRNKYAN